MFCTNCGKEIDDNAVICPGCGVPTDNMKKAAPAPASAPAPAQKNTMALVGFILALLGFNLIALILSIVGLTNCKKPEYAGDGKGFAIAGIIISSISLGIILITVIAVVGVGCAAGCAALGAM